MGCFPALGLFHCSHLEDGAEIEMYWEVEVHEGRAMVKEKSNQTVQQACRKLKGKSNNEGQLQCLME